MLFGYFVLALLPILWLIVAMSVIKMQAWTAALSAMVIAFVEAMVFWPRASSWRCGPSSSSSSPPSSCTT